MTAEEARLRLETEIAALSHFTHWGRSEVLALGVSDFRRVRKAVRNLIERK